MALDNAKNFAKVTVSTGYSSAATSIVLSSGHGAKLPTAPFNAVWWNSSDYTDPTDDPNVEIVRVTAISTDTLTVTRGQESTSAVAHNTAGKTYKMVAGLTAKTINTDMQSLNMSQINDTGGTKKIDLSTSNAIRGNNDRAVLRDNSFEEWQTNGETEVGVNYQGYNNGATQFRNFTIYDGKNTQYAKFYAANKALMIGNSSNPTHTLQLANDDAAKTTTTTWTTTSDRRTKKKIKDYTEGLDILLQLTPKKFTYNGKASTPKGEQGVNFVAQDIENIAPDMIRRVQEKLNRRDKETTEILKVNPHNLQFMLVNAVKELSARVEQLEKQLAQK